MNVIIHEQEQRRRAAQRRVDERRRQLLDPIRTSSPRRGISKSHTMHTSSVGGVGRGEAASPIVPRRGARGRAASFSSKFQNLTLLTTTRSPTFDYPQPVHPQSAREKTLSQELALCDFRSYLLAMEAQNRERLRQVRSNEWTLCGAKGFEGEGGSPVSSSEEDRELEEREREMAVQAEELTRRRVMLQSQLEGLTGREYPLPEMYGRAEREMASVSPGGGCVVS